MQSRSAIVRQLEHFKTGCAARDTAETQTWIKALEWVLGDEKHQAAYDEWLRSIESLSTGPDLVEAVRNDVISSHEIALRLLLERLR